MNLTVLLIAAYLPLPLVLFMILRSGSFGKGSVGTLLKLFFLGAASAVPAFLMEAGGLLVINILLRLFPDDAFGGNMPLVSAILRYFVAVALIEEGWKHFVLRSMTWKQMTMDTIADGIAAAAVVGSGFAAVMYGAWQAASYLISSDMNGLRSGMPDFLQAGAVAAFLYAVMYILSHFGFSGLMGAVYGVAKGSEQKEHGRRAGFMLLISCLLPVLAHGFCAAMIGYGIAQGQMLWFAIGLALQLILALFMMAVLSRASDAGYDDQADAYRDREVDFADSEEFADFAEAAGTADHAENTENTGNMYLEEKTEDSSAPAADSASASEHSPDMNAAGFSEAAASLDREETGAGSGTDGEEDPEAPQDRWGHIL